MSKPKTQPIKQQPVVTAHQVVQHYQGMLPPPSMLQGFDDIVDGTAQRIIDLAISESEHRRGIETSITQANIAAQQSNSQLATSQSKSAAFSVNLGQILGFITCVACIGASIFAATIGHELLSLALAAMPTAAIIKAYFVK